MYANRSIPNNMPGLIYAQSRVELRRNRPLYGEIPRMEPQRQRQLESRCGERCFDKQCGRRGGLIVSALHAGSGGSGSSSGWGHYVVFLGKTLYFHSASLHPGV